MSVSFVIPGGPVMQGANEVECHCAQQGDPWEDCPHCEGLGKMPYEEPEHFLNLSNANAIAVLRAMGLPVEDLCGSVEAEQVSDLRRSIMGALNRDSARAPHLREDVNLEAGHAGVKTIPQADGTVRIQRMGAQWIGGGLNDEGLCKRLSLLDVICEVAQDLGLGICWS